MIIFDHGAVAGRCGMFVSTPRISHEVPHAQQHHLTPVVCRARTAGADQWSRKGPSKRRARHAVAIPMSAKETNLPEYNR
ncbi:hypothetical protein GCM10010387_59620 [Streptomyces inusitatus]|uniref:Uncharacterized protein n=1 Tax=Streptomyces inusitatus TaxID=68221 RepID=A0A918V384_9ACTN|nr:hypothetical protein GCM10010387_59620 [Streptomyces inusitatus]